MKEARFLSGFLISDCYIEDFNIVNKWDEVYLRSKREAASWEDALEGLVASMTENMALKP